jgi:hypothetical protein
MHMPVHDGPILNPNNKYRRVILPAAMAKVKAEGGKSPKKQAYEIWRLSRAAGELTADDYYLHGLYRDTLTPEEKREYASLTGSTALNKRLGRRDTRRQDNLINDKLMTGAVLTAAGCPMPQISAMAALRTLPKGYKAMKRPSEILDFLKTVPLPVFGKPLLGSRGLGVMSLFQRSDDGRIGVMGDGREILLAALAAEILQLYPDGYIFQPFVANHPEIAEANPHAAQALRFVTVWGEGEPELLYVTWRIPGMTALSDNNTTAGHQVTASVDVDTGVAGRARSHEIFGNLEGYESHPESGFSITGRVIPHFKAGRETVLAMHTLFPGHAILGWDVVPSVDGPVILEANANPIHFGYQLGHQRGIMNPDIMAKLRPIIAQQNPGFRQKLIRLGEQARR